MLNSLTTLKPTLTTTLRPAVDDVATGAQARAYRVARRIRLDELAERLKTPTGVRMTVPNLSHYEFGDRKWTQALFNDYVAAVDAINAKIPA